MPIAIKCEDNYKIRAAAIHYFYILKQITSRKLHVGSLKGFEQQLIHYRADFRRSPLSEFFKCKRPYRIWTYCCLPVIFIHWQRVISCSADEAERGTIGTPEGRKINHTQSPENSETMKIKQSLNHKW
jgi:hypothetical protein